jgi:DnaJ-class molecular chaperone
LIFFQEKKRESYDKYGKEGLARGESNNMHHDPFEGFGNAFGRFGGFNNHHARHHGFHFRSPQDIFAEFFGTNNIFEVFDDEPFGHMRRQTSRQDGSSHKRQRGPDTASNIMSTLFAMPTGFDFGNTGYCKSSTLVCMYINK